MLNISYAGCFGLSLAISIQFIFKMCVASWNREKFTKNLFLGFEIMQGRQCW